MILLAVLAFIFGAVEGSFANCLIWRLPRDESIVAPPSHCPACSHQLGFWDLIPILSFIFLKGKCRYCHKNIGLKYLIVELIMGTLFSLIVIFFHSPLEIIFYAVLSVILIIQAFIDLEHQILPDSLTFLVAVAALLYQGFRGPSEIWPVILSGIGAGLFMFLIGYVSSLIWKQETLGGGDVKLAVAFGFIFGWPKIILVLFLSFLIGSVIGLFLILVLKKSKKDYMPFGPAMILAAFLTIFLGNYLIELYIRYFFLGYN